MYIYIYFFINIYLLISTARTACISLYKQLKSHHHLTWKLPAAGNVGSGGVASGSDGNEKIQKPLRKVSCSERQLPHCSLKDSHLKFM